MEQTARQIRNHWRQLDSSYPNQRHFELALAEAELPQQIHFASSGSPPNMPINIIIFWHELCCLVKMNDSKESEVNQHEKTYTSAGGAVDAECDNSIGLCRARRIPSPRMVSLALVERCGDFRSSEQRWNDAAAHRWQRTGGLAVFSLRSSRIAFCIIGANILTVESPPMRRRREKS